MIPIIYSEKFLEHKTGMLHPERPERLLAITNLLKKCSFQNELEWLTPTPVQERQTQLMQWIGKVHTADYIDLVAKTSGKGGGYIDGDTPVSEASYQTALLAVSAWLDGIDVVLFDQKPAFVLARPPGHHAESSRGMGFCLFGNAAIAAYYALSKPNIKKVAILDWDVHHGNGTQSIVENDHQIAYCSLHQYPCYPGTGSSNEHGKYNNVLNIPILPGSGSAVYKMMFEKKVMPFLRNFQPDLLIVSAGYDANEADPLANINLHPEDYGLFTAYCLQITRKIVFGLEGGYDLPSLAASVMATLAKCLE